MMEIHVCAFLITSGLILWYTRFNVVNPAFLFSSLIAVYGHIGIYLVDEGLLAQFDTDTIDLGFKFSVATYFAFLTGCALLCMTEKSIKRQYKQPARHGNALNSLSFAPIPMELNVCLILICTGGVIALMLLSAEGSIYEFITNLHVRQVSSVGYNWIMFFVLAGRLPINNALGELIQGERRSLAKFIGYTVPLTMLIGLAGGRQFALLIILQAYIIYSKFKPVPLYTKLAAFVIGLLIFFVYGFARYFQGIEDSAEAIDYWAFLSGENQNQNFMTVMETVMLDGWYILLSAIDATKYSAAHGDGAVLLSSLAKIIPGSYDSAMSFLYPDYKDIIEQYDLQYRAMSFGSEVWLDFGWFGVFLFVVFGYFSMLLYRRLMSASAGFWETLVLSSLFVYLLSMIRNGMGWFVAYISIEMLWFIIVLGFINMTSGFKRGHAGYRQPGGGR